MTPTPSSVSPEKPKDESSSLTDVQNEQIFVCTEDRKLGFFSIVFLIVNAVMGTGIFSTPSIVFTTVNSAGSALMLWLTGAILTLCGLLVYLEYGLAIPKSGGDKNYLERVYRRPKGLITCIFMVAAVVMEHGSANCVAFGEYVLLAAGNSAPASWQTKGIGIAAITFACILHAIFPKTGTRLMNLLGACKIVLILLIIFAGFAALGGHLKIPKADNFNHPFENSSTDAYDYVIALNFVNFSYSGWQSANYILSEVKRPGKTMLVAGTTALAIVTVSYMLVNVAYFAAVPRDEIVSSGLTIAGQFFLNVFGDVVAARALPSFIALSALGNVLAVTFTAARVKQEIAKEGILPFSYFWASDKPFRTPAAALLLQWVCAVVLIVSPPAGDLYTFVVNLSSYQAGILGTLIGGGLLYLQYRKSENWTPPFHCHILFTMIFILSHLISVIIPFIPPKEGNGLFESIPYYILPVVGFAILGLAVIYWFGFVKLVPRFRGYKIVTEREDLTDGNEIVRYIKIRLIDTVNNEALLVDIEEKPETIV